MRYKLFLWFVLCCFALCANAQDEQERLTISGRLIEAIEKSPLSQATVQLFWAKDSSFVGGTLTNERGSFSVQAPSNGIYRLKISSIGYRTLEREVTIRNGRNQALGELQMATETVLLKEAVVTSQVPQVVVKKDTLLYNPEAYRTPEGSAIEELIKRMPGADIDEDGNITVNGKAVKKILIDGKEFMLGDTETALKNIPVSIIQNVKFYDQQSDQARITGIEDGNKETVLDFTIKKGMNRGYMTNIDVAGGTHERYATRGTGSSFTDNTRLMVLGNANNKEEWNRRGLNTSKMVGANFNYDDSKKLRIDASLRWNHRNGDNQNENTSENFYSEDHRTFYNSQSKNLSRSNNLNGNMRLEWKPDTLTNILFRANGSDGTNDGTGNSKSATFSNDPYDYVTNPLEDVFSERDSKLLPYSVNKNQSNSLSYGHNKNAWGMLQFYRRLNPRGRNIVVRIEGSIGSNQQRNASNNEVRLFRVKNQAGQDSTYFTARYNTTPSQNRGYVLSSTYSEPLWKGAHLQASYELRFNRNKSDRQTYDFSKEDIDVFSGITPEYRNWDAWIGETSQFASLDRPLSDFLDRSLSRYSEYKNYTWVCWHNPSGRTSFRTTAVCMSIPSETS